MGSHITGSITANCATEGWTFKKLDLELIGGQDPNSEPPLAFNVVDTSNLCDHLGFLNIAMAYFPLLVPHATSTMYTELLVCTAAGPDQRIKLLVGGGDFDTMSLLLGMANIESWTNATVDTEADENLIQKAMTSMNREVKTKRTQHRQRLAWKSAKSLLLSNPALFIQPQDLVKLVMHLHDNMFQHEDLAYNLNNLGMLDIEEMSMPTYNRASFVSVLAYLKRVVTTDWSAFNILLYNTTASPGKSLIGGNYLQDLYVQLHLQNVLSVDILKRPLDKRVASHSLLPLKDLNDIPAVLCLTIKAPAGSVRYVVENMGDGIGIPSLCCTIENMQGGWSNVFSSVQAGFGKIKAKPPEPRQLPTLEVQEAIVDWNGKSSMVVSVYVPTWILLQNSEGTTVSVGFQPTPVTTLRNRKLGPILRLHTARLQDSPCIYSSKYMPHLGELSLTAGNSAQDSKCDTALLNNLPLDDCGKITRIQRRISITGNHKSMLAEKTTTVHVSQITPVRLGLHIGNGSLLSVLFPRPVSAKYSKLRVARKSAYVEIIAPFMSSKDADMQQSWMFPISLSPHTPQIVVNIPVTWNMPYINVRKMPQLDLEKSGRLEWSNPHTSQMFSTRERTIRDGNLSLTTSYASSLTPRIDFKDGLLNIFAFVTQTGSAKMGRSMVFGLHRPNDGDMHVLIFVSAAMLDVNSRTIALDAAVLPLILAIVQNPQYHKVFSKIGPSTIRPINMSKDELLVWKHNLPALVERCRTWSHDPKSCEYLKEGSVPLPSGLKDGASPICSCGCGALPDSFSSKKDLRPFSSLIKKHATRIVLSPTFAVPHVEPCSDIPQSAQNEGLVSEAQEWLENSTGNCAQCGASERKDSSNANKTLSKCGNCFGASYCSRDCQQKHWKADHKIVCKKAAVQA